MCVCVCVLGVLLLDCQVKDLVKASYKGLRQLLLPIVVNITVSRHEVSQVVSLSFV